MLKEIHDQPRTITDTFRGQISLNDGSIALEGIPLTAGQTRRVKKIHVVACGTAWHAGLVGKFMLEEIAGIPAEGDYGSEFRYRAPLIDRESRLLLISQSAGAPDTPAPREMAR